MYTLSDDTNRFFLCKREVLRHEFCKRYISRRRQAQPPEITRTVLVQECSFLDTHFNELGDNEMPPLRPAARGQLDKYWRRMVAYWDVRLMRS